MFIPKLNSKCVFKYIIENCHWQNVLKETKSLMFCLFSYCRLNFYQFFGNQLLVGAVVLM